ncbi:uncharacterized protein LOC133188733 [Saccostrea echinata]|uniref:uncharacterized protein LOC133188733 n=1 Tax=Saccostrea echinata TaxID=191078 RepID=UPI002A7F7943|nr:uncharacterized protein LOC133188733 [Saccostrea echinata]
MPVTWNRLLFSDVSDNAAKNGTGIIVRDEVKIETVIIILWVAGGVLLMTLLILLVCILRNNKKTGAQCANGSHVLRIDPRRANPRDGRLNQGYSNYDEIWTWIPIIRGNEGECPRSSVYATPTSNDLQPPSYNEVVGSPETHPAAANSQTTVRTPEMTTIQPGNPVSNLFSATSRSSEQMPATASTEVVAGRTSEQNPQIPSVPVRTLETHNADSVPSGSPSVASTNIVENASQSNQRLQSESNRSDNYIDRNCVPRQNIRTRNCDYPYLARARDRPGNTTNSISSATENQDQYQDVIYHPEQGLYSFVRNEGGRRAWCDIPPSLLNEDGPPPYTPAPDYPGRHHNTRRTSYRQAVNDMPPRYSRRSKRLTDVTREVPPDYPMSNRETINSRIEHVHGNVSAPIVRCDYEYF